MNRFKNQNDSKGLDKIRLQSKNFSKLVISEFAYCSILFFMYKVSALQSNLIFGFYIGLLIIFPLIINSFLYFKSKKNVDLLNASNIVIAQILILIFSFKFLI